MQAPTTTQPPLTGAEVSEKWKFDHFTLAFIGEKFGDIIQQVVERSPTRGFETSNGATNYTNCMRIHYPEWPGQDAMVWFNIGAVDEIAPLLYQTALTGKVPRVPITSTQGLPCQDSSSTHQSEGIIATNSGNYSATVLN